MIEAMDDSTMAALRFALDAASLRHRVFALRAALGQSARVDPAVLGSAAPVAVRTTGPGAADAKVALDMEIAKIAKNAVQYQALLRGVGKRLSILGAAINEGRR